MNLITYQLDEATVQMILRGLALQVDQVRRTMDQIALHANATLNPPPSQDPQPARPRRLRKRT